jgi:flagellar biosynthesis/type III secretory pathway protein FliH
MEGRGVDQADAGETGRGRPAAARRIPAEVFDARRAARALLEEAARDAERIRRDAEAGAQRQRLEAARAGREEGLAAAAARIALASDELERLLAASAPEVLEIAVALAERILGRAVAPGDDALRAARLALAEVAWARRATLRASPADAAAWRSAGASPGLGLARLRVVEDPSLAPGEVVVQADGASVDARFPCQLAELRRAVEGGP